MKRPEINWPFYSIERVFMRPELNDYFMTLAKVVSTRSTCNIRKIGCVIVKDKKILATGYNGSAPNADHCSDKGPKFCYKKERGKNESIYSFCVSSHAESNAVSHAAKEGILLKNSTIYSTLSPCLNCMKSLLIAGVSEVYYELRYFSGDSDVDEYWLRYAKENFNVFKEFRVNMDYISSVIYRLNKITSDRLL